MFTTLIRLSISVLCLKYAVPVYCHSAGAGFVPEEAEVSPAHAYPAPGHRQCLLLLGTAREWPKGAFRASEGSDSCSVTADQCPSRS